jgi:phosphopantothenoylcysteine decarboxylase/phosphopantothenate--cysteine ligase
MSLSGKRILLGVTGSIAAYKSALLVRLLVKAGAEVQVILTRAAHDFITPLTLATLSKRPVLTEFVANDGTGTWHNHVDLGLWADAYLIAPATAHSLAKCAHGFCDDLLTAAYLSARCPVWFAPAMDVDMMRHPSTVESVRKLESYGNSIIEPEHGELASGLVGEGRLAEPETIVQVLERHFSRREAWVGKRVLLTAGPTQEALDPVRFISNHSTGKMGYALADRLAAAGAAVTLVSGPVGLKAPLGVEVVPIRSAQELYEAAQARFAESDVVILAAAVADYAPSTVSEQKIKKSGDTLTLELARTVDSAATLGMQKQPGQVLVGFALETENERENALKKLRSKKLDLIVLNSLRDAGAGFGHETNRVTLLDRNERVQEFGLKSKTEVADDIIQTIETLLAESSRTA